MIDALPIRAGFIVCLLSSIACSHDDDKDTIKYELFSSSRLLAAADLEAIVADGEDGTLVFEPAPAALADLQPGMVLVGSASSKTPTGLLRGVGAVTRDGDRLTLRTMVVPVQLAFKSLHAHAKRSDQTFTDLPDSRDPSDSGLAELQLLATAAEGSAAINWVLFDGDGDETTQDDQVRLEGDLGGSFQYDVQIDVDWGAITDLPDAVTTCIKSIPDILDGKLPDCTPTALLPEVLATFDVGPDLSASAELIGSASLSYEKEVTILKTTLTPIPIGPLVLVPGVDVVGGLKGSAGAHFETGFDSALSVRMKIVSSTKNGVTINPPKVTRSDISARPTELSIMADGRLTLGAKLSMSIYGVVGPYAEADSYADIAADISKDPCWELTAGLSAGAGLVVTSPRLPILGYVTLVDVKTPDVNLFGTGAIASGSCGFGDAPPATLPGSGPSEQNYGAPQFTPWSQVATLAGDTTYVAAGTLGADVAFSAMERATDGRFLAGANGSARIEKIDENGAVTWSLGFADAGADYALGRVAGLRDTSIVAATTTSSGPAVLRFGESGALFGGSAFAFAAGCNPSQIIALQGLSPAAAGGAAYAFTGSCLGTDNAYLVTATQEGDVVAAYVLSAPDKLAARAMSVVGDDLWWLGLNEAAALDQMAAVRFDGSINALATSAFHGNCGNQIVEPAFARPALARSELLVVGSSGGEHEGLFARLRPDATVAIGTFPSYGPGASEVSVLHAIVELPTTGYIVAGSHYDVLADPATGYNTVAPFLAWLDAGGSVLSAKRVTLDGGAVATAAPRIELTDDGGLMVSAVRSGGPTYDLWTMKVFAKDATIADPRVNVAPLTITTDACALIAEPLTLTVTPISVSRQTLSVASH